MGMSTKQVGIDSFKVSNIMVIGLLNAPTRESKTETENRKTGFEFKTENRFWNQIGFEISNPQKWAILGKIHVTIGNFSPQILPLIFHNNETHSERA